MRSTPLFSPRSGKLQGFGGLLAVFTEILVCRTCDAISWRPPLLPDAGGVREGGIVMSMLVYVVHVVD